MNKKALDDLYEYLYSVLLIHQNICEALKDELIAIEKDDIATLNDKLKTQQALVLEVRNFDKKVDEYLTSLELPSTNLSSLICYLPKVEQPKFYALLGSFDTIIKEIEFYKQKSRVLLLSKRNYIDRILKNSVPKYNRDASESRDISLMLETTI